MKVVEMGRNAVLMCEATGEPSPVITWVKDVRPIDFKVGYNSYFLNVYFLVL